MGMERGGMDAYGGGATPQAGEHGSGGPGPAEGAGSGDGTDPGTGTVACAHVEGGPRTDRPAANGEPGPADPDAAAARGRASKNTGASAAADASAPDVTNVQAPDVTDDQVPDVTDVPASPAVGGESVEDPAASDDHADQDPRVEPEPEQDTGRIPSASQATAGDADASTRSARTVSPAGPAPSGETAGAGAGAPPARRTGIDALSLRYQIVAALALAVVALGAVVHLLLVFLHVAPSNTVSQQHSQLVNGWILPEFEQNWKLFAPNPLQQNIHVQVRAEKRNATGDVWTTGWYDLSAADAAAVDHNPAPSHVTQNELRRGWEFFAASHDDQNRPIGARGTLAETYLRRIVVLRLHEIDQKAPGADGVVQRLQVRSMTTNVQLPKWSGRRVDTRPVYRTFPWWSVGAADRPLGLRAAPAAPRHTDVAAHEGSTTEASHR